MTTLTQAEIDTLQAILDRTTDTDTKTADFYKKLEEYEDPYGRLGKEGYVKRCHLPHYF
jgi:hypothetical protein